MSSNDGLTSSEEYTYISYRCMLRRCYEKGHRMYEAYGGSGITVDERWRGVGGFKRFFEDMGRRPKAKTLDRKDSTKGYSKENCKWSTDKQQNRNRIWKKVKLKFRETV